MNLILFESHEASGRLIRTDARAVHILETLRMGVGSTFDAGIVNGPRGKARIVSVDSESIGLEFELVSESDIPHSLDILVGLPRPQSARRILHDSSALGVRKLALVSTAHSDPNYAESRLWSTGEWRRHLVDGAQQAFDTRIPEVVRCKPLAEVAMTASGVRLALDIYEATIPLLAAIRATPSPPREVTLAFGPERGWAQEDRRTLRAAGFGLVSLGRRVMRVETAIASAVAIIRSELGWN